MPNKHAAGCQCCAEGECSPCDKTISNVSVTMGSETVSWSVNKAINAIPSCLLLLTHCTTKTEYDLLDYYIDHAYDGRIGDCYQGFLNGPRPGEQNGCCNVTEPPGPGGGGGPGVGGGPTPADTCVPCGVMVKLDPDPVTGEPGFPCQFNEYWILTQKLDDLTAKVKIRVWDEYSVELRFVINGANQDVQYKIARDTRWSVERYLSYSLTSYYNSNCSLDSDCLVPTEDCESDIAGINFDLYGQFHCDRGVPFPAANYEFTSVRYMMCDATPTWNELTTSTYCLNEGCGFPDVFCDPEGTVSDTQWNDKPYGDPLCFVNYWGEPQILGDFNAFPIRTESGNSRDPMFGVLPAFNAAGTDPVFLCNHEVIDGYGQFINNAMEPTRCDEECGSYLLYRAFYAGTLTKTCAALCGAHSIDFVGTPEAAQDITAVFDGCLLTQCSDTGSAPGAADNKCQIWRSECCLDSSPPVDVTVPTSNKTAPNTITLTISCAP